MSDSVSGAPLPALLDLEYRRRYRSFLETLHAIGRSIPPAVTDSLPRVFAISEFVAQTCQRDPRWLDRMLEDGRLLRPVSRTELAQQIFTAVRGVADTDYFMCELRRVRRSELSRIAWRDLAGLARVEEVLNELTWLAEILIEVALKFAEQTLESVHGAPGTAAGECLRLCVLGLGKLGGGELNFSSDVDLIFAYAEEGQTNSLRPLDHRTYFTRLGQLLIRLLSEVTADSFVYRVDMRLRPFGDTGSLVQSFSALEAYYQAHGREWERYALIKARPIAGDLAGGRKLLGRLNPFIYRRYLDYGVFESLRELKALIAQEALRRKKDNDVKLSPGGIREIEFIAQVFQLVRGGRERDLQLPGTRKTLQRLGRRSLLPERTADHLRNSYDFLRRVENHLQMSADHQVHALPTDEMGKLRLAWGMDFPHWEAFSASLEAHRCFVRKQFELVFSAPQIKQVGDSLSQRIDYLWLKGESEEWAEILTELGFDEPQVAAIRLVELRSSQAVKRMSEIAAKRLRQLLPMLLHIISHQTPTTATWVRLLDIVRAILGRSVYLSLLVENPSALSQLVKLSAASPWIVQQLVRTPQLLDEMLDSRRLYAYSDREHLRVNMDKILADISPNDLEQSMDILRRFKRNEVLRVAAADVSGALPLVEVSDRLTWIAEVILKRALELAWVQPKARYGKPLLMNGSPAGFGVIAYGKLGGLELGYGSDLDLVFLYQTINAGESTEGDRSIENALFFSRLVRHLVHILTTYTSAGNLYEIDMRLRPSGASGLLVSPVNAFAVYQREHAWTWEHQALVRARFVAGSEKIDKQFSRIRKEILAQPRDRETVQREVREMRQRMWHELGITQGKYFDLKKDPGGLADIEFLVQYIVLVHAHVYPAMLGFTDNFRLLEYFGKTGLLTDADAAFLSEAYRCLRQHTHVLALQNKSVRIETTGFTDLRSGVREIWNRYLGPDD